MDFLCSKCGACCRVAGGKLGLPDRGDGACGYLNKDNTCSVYDSRPEVCRVDVMAAKSHLSKKDYYVESTKACHTLIDKLGLESKYKVDIKDYDK